MKCQILFSEKNTKNIVNLLSAELAQRVVKVNAYTKFYQNPAQNQNTPYITVKRSHRFYGKYWQHVP